MNREERRISPLISLIIPACNEEENIRIMTDTLNRELAGCRYEVIFIDDGSTDNTLAEIKKARETDSRVEFLSFCRNFGHQNALKAGMDAAKGDCAITLDADLQHPPRLIPSMIDLWKSGYQIVNTIRRDNKSVAFPRRLFSKLFYHINNMMSEVRIDDGSADFRLMDRAVLETLKKMDERMPFYRGLVPWTGFKSTTLTYNPDRRIAGRSKYTLNRRLKFALCGLVSFSVMPLRAATLLGFAMALWGFVIGLKAVYENIFTDKTIPGWTSTVVLVVLIGGIQLIILGIIGEYLGRIFIESKKRPHYIISESSLGEKVSGE